MKVTSSSGIQFAEADDIDAIFEIEQKCFPGQTSYSKRQLRYLVLNANSISLVARDKETIKAFVIVTFRKGNLSCNVETIDVDPVFKNKGLGLKLLMAAEKEMKERGMRSCQLEVSEGNKSALNLYRKAGYIFKERLEGYYRFEHNGTRNALRMMKIL